MRGLKSILDCAQIMANGFDKSKVKHRKKSVASKQIQERNLIQLATEAYESKKLLKSQQYCQEIITQQTDNADAWIILGNIERSQGNIASAIAAYQQVLSLQPQNFDLISNLGVLYIQQQQPDKAIKLFQKALELNPNYAQAYNNLGQLHQDLGKSSAAKTYLQKSIKLQPNYATAHYNLGNVEKCQGNLSIAIACYLRAIQLNPNVSDVHNNLGNTYLERGETALALKCFQQAIALGSPKASGEHNFLFALHYTSDFSPQEIYTQHQSWGAKYQSLVQAEIKPPQPSLDPDRKLRIGYISGDFKTHSVNYFFEPLLTNHDSRNFEITCYANNKSTDAVTARLRQQADSWREIAYLDDAVAAKIIREDKIDILVDLAGHTLGNRLGIFARKPAPLQVTYLGYPNTTGLTAIDYRLTDSYADPLGTSENLHTEKLIHLSQSFLCYQPLADTPDVNPLPATSKGYITFGSFNALPKVSQEIIGLWAAILKQVPQSRLLLKAKSFSDQTTRDRIYQLFQQSGIERDRLDLRGWVKDANNHLAIYNEVDLALDTYPYHGTTTTCEAFWMGIPVITLAGNSHVSRVGVSFLTSLGLTELITHSPGEYISKAVSLAHNLPQLAQLRSNMRSRMQASPLTDAKAIARKIESAYHHIWQQWCQQQAPALLNPVVPLQLKTKSPQPLTIKPKSTAKISANPDVKQTICTIHHLSASGGTLISKCLAAMPNVILLSEINPYCLNSCSFNPFDPIPQLTRYNLLTLNELKAIFLERIDLIFTKCQQTQKNLIIRDHAHSDFLLNQIATHPSLLTTLQTKYNLKPILTLRHPIDSWLSMIPQGWHRQVKTFEGYCDRYLKLLEAYQGYTYYLYEDFTRQPDATLQRMCQDYGIDFDPNYKDKFAQIRLSGDSGRTATEIATPPRREYPQSFVAEVKRSLSFAKICQKLGYSGIEDKS